MSACPGVSRTDETISGLLTYRYQHTVDQIVKIRSSIISTFKVIVVLVLAELVLQRTSFNVGGFLDDSLLEPS